jgi:hypothetical protein
VNQASEFQYKRLDDIRYLGPPHQRFPDMHPEKRLWPVENEVYLEMKILFGLGWRIFWMAMAGALFFCGLGILIVGGFSIILFPYAFCFFGLTGLFALFTLLTHPHQPVRLYRPTQELIYCIKGHIHRRSWAKMPVRIIRSFQIRGGYSIYTLQFGLGKDALQPMSYIRVGGGEEYEERALRDWEYYCRYMEKGHVELQKPMEREKTRQRKYWEEFWESPFLKITGLIVIPTAWVMAKLWDKSFFKYKWPQEVIDICENQPLLREDQPD